MSKRKRDNRDGDNAQATSIKSSKVALDSSPQSVQSLQALTLQIITGSYERALHGITATVPVECVTSSSTSGDDGEATQIIFADSFLFNAHTSAVRCVAISPISDTDDSSSQKVLLATGGTDERVNLYHLSSSPPVRGKIPSQPSLAGTTVAENHRNRQLGSLLHHSASVTTLHFPSRSKLLSAAEDNTIAVTRTRDWTLLSTIKAPIPKPAGRPSGDTAGPGEVPTGINHFAVHPSLKLMVSVGKGERCMRLWNLVTGKKAGVLNFDKQVLQQVGEGRWSRGEGQKVEWSPDGEEFVVCFERGAVIYGMDSKPKATIFPTPATKLHQLRYVPRTLGSNVDNYEGRVLAVSTEDGRVLFYSNEPDTEPQSQSGEAHQTPNTTEPPFPPSALFLGQVGGPETGIYSRIKDFMILTPPSSLPAVLFVVTASSDGAIRIWRIDRDEFCRSPKIPSPVETTEATKDAASASPEVNGHGENGVAAELTNGGQTHDDSAPPKPSAKQIGQLLGTYETGSRITCMTAFVMKSDSAVNEPPSRMEGDEEDLFRGEATSDDEEN